MNLTLTQRREIVEGFKSGKSIERIFAGLNPQWRCLTGPMMCEIEQVLRDFLLGKFKLKEKKR